MKIHVLVATAVAVVGVGCGADSGTDDEPNSAANSAANAQQNAASNSSVGNSAAGCPVSTDVAGGVVYDRSTFPLFTFKHPESWTPGLGNDLNEGGDWYSLISPVESTTALNDMQLEVTILTELRDTRTALGEVIGTFDYGDEPIEVRGILGASSSQANFSLPWEGRFVTTSVRIASTVPECDELATPMMWDVLETFEPNPDTTFVAAQ